MAKRKKSKYHNLRSFYYLFFNKCGLPNQTKVDIFKWNRKNDKEIHIKTLICSDKYLDSLGLTYPLKRFDYENHYVHRHYGDKFSHSFFWHSYYWYGKNPFVFCPCGVKSISHRIHREYWNERSGNHYSAIRSNYMFDSAVYDYLDAVPLQKYQHRQRHKKYSDDYDDIYYWRSQRSTGWKESTKCRHQYLIHV